MQNFQKTITSSVLLLILIGLIESGNVWPHYNNFYNLFSTCTTIYSRESTLLTRKDLLQNHLNYCISTQQGQCVTLHMQVTPTKALDGLDLPRSVAFRNITPFASYSKIFSGNRHVSACTVHLPVVQKDLVWYAVYLNRHKNVNFYPTYILVPTSNVNKVSLSRSFLYLYSYLFYLNDDSYSISTVCLSCGVPLSTYFHHGPGIPLIDITRWCGSLDMIVRRWRDVNYNKLHSFRHVSCINPSIEQDVGMLHSDFGDCAKLMIIQATNCTTTNCKHAAHEITHAFLNAFVYKKMEHNALVSSYAIGSFGLSYIILIQKPKGKWGGMHLLALLSPFDFHTWLLLATICFITSGLFKWSGFTVPDACFWLFSAILEQGKNRSSGMKGYMLSLVMLWLLGCIFWRNAYTSSMYSYMTLEKGPSNVPSSFTEILYNTTLRFLGQVWLGGHLSSYSQFIISVRSPNVKLWTSVNKTLERLWYTTEDSMYDTFNDDTVPTNFSFLSKLRNVNNEREEVFERSYIQRFSYLYLTNNWQMLLNKFYLYHSNHFRIIESNEPPILTNALVWLYNRHSYMRETSSFVHACRIWNLRVLEEPLTF